MWSGSLAQQVLEGLGQAVAVINRDRQILYVNQAMNDLVQVELKTMVGRLPGEALGCIHLNDGPAGCGSGPACLHCGTQNAIQASQESFARVTKEARLTLGGAQEQTAVDFEVTAAPLQAEHELTLLSFRDISAEKRRSVLERMFFHDVLNLSGGLQGLLQLWPELAAEEAAEVQHLALAMSEELSEEIQAGRALAAAERGELAITFEEYDAAAALEWLAAAYRKHSVAESRDIVVRVDGSNTELFTDPVLLRRILGNLVKNALEATRPGGTITLSFSRAPESTFRVHNPGVMPPEVAAQVFHRSFSTKAATGRGIGTYSVKLLTEQYLHGTVSFVSTVDAGTIFEVTLPDKGGSD